MHARRMNRQRDRSLMHLGIRLRKLLDIEASCRFGVAAKEMHVHARVSRLQGEAELSIHRSRSAGDERCSGEKVGGRLTVDANRLTV